MSDKKANQLLVLKYFIDNIYDLKSYKKREEHPKTFIDDHFSNYMKLLHSLPKNLDQYFSEIVKSILLKQDESNSFKYRTVWFGANLKSIYQGIPINIFLPDCWEDNIDFYKICEKMYVDMISS